MTLDKTEQFILDEEDFDVSEIGLNFVQESLDTLGEDVKKDYKAECQKFTYTLPEITEVDKIVKKVKQDFKTIVKNRTKKVK